MNAIPDALPAGFIAYARSPDFTPETLPAKLQAAHTTKPGTWALLHVLEGQVLYELEPPRSGQRLVSAGAQLVIEAQVFHHVHFTKPGRIFIEFFRHRDAVKA